MPWETESSARMWKGGETFRFNVVTEENKGASDLYCVFGSIIFFFLKNQGFIMAEEMLRI